MSRLRCSICRADGSGLGPRRFEARATRSAVRSCLRQIESGEE
jgi:hypothetical protein